MFNRITKFLIRLMLGFIVLSLAWVVLYKFVPVKWTPLMLKRCIQNNEQKEYKNRHTWVNIFEKDATAQAEKGVKASGQRARKVSLALEKELKNFRKVSLEAIPID